MSQQPWGTAPDPSTPVPPSAQPTAGPPTPTPIGSGSGRRPNPPGMAALVLAVAGTGCSLVTSAAVPLAPLGWGLLVVALVLAIVALVLPGRGRGFAIAGLGMSIVGMMIAGAVIVVSLVDAGLTPPETVPPPATSKQSEEQGQQQNGEAAGTLDDPFPLGTPIAIPGWTYTIEDVEVAPETVAAQMTASGEYFVPLQPGQRYIVMTYTITNDGTAAAYPAEIVTEPVTSGDEKLNLDLARYVLDDTSLLPPGESRVLSVAFLIPEQSDPLLRVTPNIVADPVYVTLER